MYTIRNKKTKKWVYGTDYRYYPPHQRTAFDRALLFDSYEKAQRYFVVYDCNKKRYEIVPVRLEELEE